MFYLFQMSDQTFRGDIMAIFKEDLLDLELMEYELIGLQEEPIYDHVPASGNEGHKRASGMVQQQTELHSTCKFS